MDHAPIVMRFNPGQLYVTPGAAEKIPEDELIRALARHISGDWGDMCSEDVALNEERVRTLGPLHSAYVSKAGIRFWVITNGGHGSTGVLLPEEY